PRGREAAWAARGATAARTASRSRRPESRLSNHRLPNRRAPQETRPSNVAGEYMRLASKSFLWNCLDRGGCFPSLHGRGEISAVTSHDRLFKSLFQAFFRDLLLLVDADLAARLA